LIHDAQTDEHKKGLMSRNCNVAFHFLVFQAVVMKKLDKLLTFLTVCRMMEEEVKG
jgi:hypothetical protein